MKYLNEFWRFHPAALYAIAVLIASGAALYSLNIWWLCCVLLCFILPPLAEKHPQNRYRLLLALTLALVSYAFTSTRYTFPASITNQPGIARLSLHSIQTTKTPFGSVWYYKGILHSFIQNEKETVKNLPITISLPINTSELRPVADVLYQIPARLKQTVHGKYVIKPIPKATWSPLETLYGLAEWRFAAKTKLQQHIQHAIQDYHVASFLSGIATGAFDDRLLATELGRFGLQHLMAISGLHFSILSALCMFTICIFCSRQTAALLTLCCMSGYFIFLGASPSVTRAWIALLIGITSLFMERHHSAINALGIAALVVILCEPLLLEDIGFQFSFATTAGILLGFSTWDGILQRLFAKRNLNIIIKADRWDQHGYCLIHLLRQSLALCLAVNSVALPLTLYHFHTFPWMSLVYNLFIPFLVSISLLLLVSACALYLIFPWLGMQLHAINESYTQFVLNFAFRLPKSFDWTLETNAISKDILLAYLLVVFSLSMLFHKQQDFEWG